MPSPSSLPPGLEDRWRCPRCGAALAPGAERFRCRASDCGAAYPVVRGVPVLIDDETCIFSLAEFTSGRATFFTPAPAGRIGRLARRLLPETTANFAAAANYRRLAETLLARSPHPRVLVLGGSIQGLGMESLLRHPQLALVETDVAFGPRTQVVCDAHRIPFADGTFDAVVAQAVLEHVCDPYACAAEIHRVLAPAGLVYAETPFLQPMHGRPYDFTRFTLHGHRRLFRCFEEIAAGATSGPGVVLADAYTYFLLSFTASRRLRRLLRAFARLTAFWLKYFDLFLLRRPDALDAASGFYFLGRKSDRVLGDREAAAACRI